MNPVVYLAKDNAQLGRLNSIALRFLTKDSFTYKIFFGPDPNKVRPKVLLLLAGLACVNIAIWVVSIIVFKPYPSMVGTGTLAYLLGLRHAVDAGNVRIKLYEAS